MAMRFFNTPKNKTFNYSPRYYDERKEELELRVKQIKREMGVDDEDKSKPYVSSIRKGQMRGIYKRDSKQNRKSSYRLLIIIAILAILVYIILYL